MPESENARRVTETENADVASSLSSGQPITEGSRTRPDWGSIRAVFFDLDDTLCPYWFASKAALRATFERFGPAGIPPEAMFEHWTSTFKEFCPSLRERGWYDAYLASGELTRTEQMRLALQRAEAYDEELAILLSQTYGRERDRRLELFPDVLPALEALKARYPLGLITNGPADVQRQEIATLRLERFFDPILIEGELGIGKPHESVFRRAEQAVGLPPESILFVGNSYHHDVAPALAVGWHAVWVRRDTDVPIGEISPECVPADSPLPDAVVGELSEVVRMLGGSSTIA